MLTMDSVVSLGENQVAADVDGQIVVLSVAHGKYVNLGETGSHIWRLIERTAQDQPPSVKVLCDRLQADFEVDRQTCEREVLQFLEKLLARDMLAVHG